MMEMGYQTATILMMIMTAGLMIMIQINTEDKVSALSHINPKRKAPDLKLGNDL